MISTLHGKSGLDINGIIEEYTAGGNISAGDFVEFVQELKQKGSINISGASYIMCDACLLTSTRAIVAYRNSSSTYVRVVEVNSSGTPVWGSSKSLSNSNSTSGGVFITRLTDTSAAVFIQQSSAYYTYVLSGITSRTSTITVGTRTSISLSFTLYYTEAFFINMKDNIICVINHNRNNNGYAYVSLYDFSSGSPSRIAIQSFQYIYGSTDGGIYCVYLDEENVLIVGAGSVHLINIDYNNNSITEKNNTVINFEDDDNDDFYYQPVTCNIDGFKFLTITNIESTGLTLKAILFEINEDDYSINILDTYRGNEEYQIYLNMAVIQKISSNKVAFFNVTPDKQIKITLFDITNNKVSLYSREILLYQVNNFDALINRNLTPLLPIYYSSSGNPYYVIGMADSNNSQIVVNSYQYVEGINKVNSESKSIKGIAKTSATTGQKAQVYVPNV